MRRGISQAEAGSVRKTSGEIWGKEKCNNTEASRPAKINATVYGRCRSWAMIETATASMRMLKRGSRGKAGTFRPSYLRLMPRKE